MQLSTALNIQNRGAFHIEDKAFKSGDTNSDRQFSGNPYMMFDDTMQFQRYTQEDEMQKQTGIGLVIDRLMNMDNRVFSSLAVTVLFSSFAQAALNMHGLATFALGTGFFVVWYVMSFFDFQRVFNVLVNGPQPQQAVDYFEEPYAVQQQAPQYPEELYYEQPADMPYAQYEQAYYPEYAQHAEYAQYEEAAYYPEYAEEAAYAQHTQPVEDDYYYYQAQPEAPQTTQTSHVVGPAFVGSFPFAAVPSAAY